MAKAYNVLSLINVIAANNSSFEKKEILINLGESVKIASWKKFI